MLTPTIFVIQILNKKAPYYKERYTIVNNFEMHFFNIFDTSVNNKIIFWAHFVTKKTTLESRVVES